MFAYCGNNPVNRVDPTGEAWWHWAVGTVVAVAAIAATVATMGAFAPAAACTLTLMGTTIGLSYATASTLATVAVATTICATSMFVADAAFASVTGSSFMLDPVFQGNVEAYNTAQQLTSIAAIGMMNLAAMSPGVCFVAGTLVKAESGDVPIEQIQVGDLVWAWDEETGDVALKKVVEVYLNQSDELIHVYVNGEEIITTPTHPFYSPVKGWTEACKLRAGDILVLVNGEYVVVEKIQHEILEAPIAVYNFQVEDYHTYYVADSGVLVHNSCNHNSSWNSERRRYWQNTASTAKVGQSYGSYVATQENINRMSRGLAPIGWDGYSVQLHHWDGIANDFYNYSPVSRTLHQLIHWGKQS